MTGPRRRTVKCPGRALTPYQERQRNQRRAIFDYVQKVGVAAAAKRFHQSERNVQRIVHRPDVRFPGIADARRHVPAEAANFNSKWASAGARFRFMEQQFTESELSKLRDVPFALVYEFALHRYNATRKRRKAHRRLKVNDKNRAHK